MASISSFNANMFSSFGTNNTGGASTNFGINLSDYGLIKRGSYYKMMKAYYETDASGSSSKNSIRSTSTSKDTTKTIAAVKNAGEDLAKSAETLYKSGQKSVFNKTTTEKDGKKTESYDTDKIYDAVKQFVSDYNTMVSAAGKSNTTSIARTGASMVNNTRANASKLAELGITIDSEDYTLSIDEEKFKKADMSVAKTLFNGRGSYGYSTAVSASMLKSYAETESNKANTYGANGSFTYNYSTGELYNDSF